MSGLPGETGLALGRFRNKRMFVSITGDLWFPFKMTSYCKVYSQITNAVEGFNKGVGAVTRCYKLSRFKAFTVRSNVMDGTHSRAGVVVQGRR